MVTSKTWCWEPAYHSFATLAIRLLNLSVNQGAAMKTRIAILVAIVALVLLGSAVLSRSDASTQGTWFCIKQASASAQEYHLTSATLGYTQGDAWRASGTANGGGYRLEPATPKLTGSGCCCLYLPLVIR
jgi:hypothetical protein